MSHGNEDRVGWWVVALRMHAGAGGGGRLTVWRVGFGSAWASMARLKECRQASRGLLGG
jgi:hypothetical protein